LSWELYFLNFPNAERIDKIKRLLDFWLGIPLLAVIGLLRLPFKRETIPQIKSVAFLCFGAIGDLILLSGVIHKLRICFPDVKICLACSKKMGRPCR